MSTVSLREIGRKAGVSASAVSQAIRDGCRNTFLSDKRRSEILKVARECGYRPNDDIAVILPKRIPSPDPFLTQAFLGIHEALQQDGNRAIIAYGDIDEVPEIVKQWECGGVVFVEQASPLAIEYLNERGGQYCIVNPKEDLEQDCILIDDASGIVAALQWLASEQCDTIVMAMPEIEHGSYHKRLDTYLAFVGNQTMGPQVLTSSCFADTMSALEKLATKQRLGVITVYEWALAIQTALAKGGDSRVVAVKGMNSLWQPPMTVLDVPLLEMGRMAVGMIHDKWQNRAIHLASRTITPKLITGDSEEVEQ